MITIILPLEQNFKYILLFSKILYLLVLKKLIYRNILFKF